ncbi:MAG: AroM family protein [Thermaerobacter sp.]
MGNTLALIVVGQAPRPDLVDEFTPLLGVDVDVLQTGLLDDLNEEEIQQLAPDDPTRAALALLADGTPVAIDARAAAGRLADRIAYVEARGADLTVVCSTLGFEPVASRRPVVYPCRVVPRTVDGLIPRGRVGVVIPLHRQEQAAMRRWEPLGDRLVLAVYHPYDDGDLTQLAGRMHEAGVSLVVLDSFDYTAEHCRDVSMATRLPVLSARRLVARIVAELLSRAFY